MRIFVSNLTVGTMYDEFRTLILSNTACNIDSLFLGSGAYGGAGISCAFNLPTAVRMGNNVLIFAHIPTSLQMCDPTTVRALARISERNNSSSTAANIILILNFHNDLQ